jgi:hypothetical protein
VDESRPDAGYVEIRRVAPDGTGRETLVRIDSVLPGASHRMSAVYVLSTISSDGARLVTSAYTGDAERRKPRWGIVRFDLATGAAEVVYETPHIMNAHPQYSRSLDPERSRDVLVQENHGDRLDPESGCWHSFGAEELGADVHVIRDDGSHLRTMPWGRDGVERCQGHQCWRGRREWAITTTVTRTAGSDGIDRTDCLLIESLPVDGGGHDGLLTPGGVRNELSRTFDGRPRFYHFATDIEGGRLVSDYWLPEGEVELYLALLGEPGREPARSFKYLLKPGTSNTKETHSHPFLSPDGRRAFFNSDESGTLQAYMIEGLP